MKKVTGTRDIVEDFCDKCYKLIQYINYGFTCFLCKRYLCKEHQYKYREHCNDCKTHVDAIKIDNLLKLWSKYDEQSFELEQKRDEISQEIHNIKYKYYESK